MKAKIIAVIAIVLTLLYDSCKTKTYSYNNLFGYWVVDSINNSSDIDDPISGLKFSSLAFQPADRLPVRIEFLSDKTYKIPDTTADKFLEDKYYFDSSLQTVYINDATIYSPWKLKSLKDSIISLSHDNMTYYLHKSK
jgi:hypothetical protein